MATCSTRTSQGGTVCFGADQVVGTHDETIRAFTTRRNTKEWAFRRAIGEAQDQAHSSIFLAPMEQNLPRVLFLIVVSLVWAGVGQVVECVTKITAVSNDMWANTH